MKSDFYLDGSNHSIEDLENISVEFMGGGSFDGKVANFGVDVVPDNLAVGFDSNRTSIVERYMLVAASADDGRGFDAYFVYAGK